MKKILILLIGLITTLAVIEFNDFVKKYFTNSNKILLSINKLNNYENDLDYEILKNSMFLYFNNDLIVKKIHSIEKILKKLKSFSFLKDRHPIVYTDLLTYERIFHKKVDMIFEYLKYSQPIKNAVSYIGYALKDINLSNPNSKYAIKYASSIFLAKSAIDKSFLEDINLSKLKGIDKSFILNLKVFLDHFPKYEHYLTNITNYKTQYFIYSFLSDYKKDLKNDVKIFEILSYLMVSFISIIFIGIVILIHLLEKSIKEIKFLAEYDPLTLLPNRLKFLEDSKNGNFICVLINIDKFKNINDVFGIEVGDKVLKEIASQLLDFSKSINAKVYRIGADDFCLLVNNNIKLETLVNNIEDFIQKIESKELKIDDLNLNISLEVGISTTKPLLENADLALKSIKNNFTKKIAVYEDNLVKEIEQNIKKAKEVIDAIRNNGIRIVFQPIFDKNKNIIKYEVLCRFLINNELKSIFPYLKILKENKLYTKVTLKVLEYSTKVLKRYKDVNLSINLGMDDILDDKVYNFIKNNLLEFKNRVTFEILESEISDYNKFEKFIKEMKKEGILFAIDDFGSGYSNFYRIISLHIDYVKIDGSLIKNIDTSFESQVIVETIVSFAKKINLKTVAEFIHNEKVFEICKQKEIDYFQGFYLGEPKEYFNYL